MAVALDAGWHGALASSSFQFRVIDLYCCQSGISKRHHGHQHTSLFIVVIYFSLATAFSKKFNVCTAFLTHLQSRLQQIRVEFAPKKQERKAKQEPSQLCFKIQTQFEGAYLALLTQTSHSLIKYEGNCLDYQNVRATSKQSLFRNPGHQKGDNQSP